MLFHCKYSTRQVRTPSSLRSRQGPDAEACLCLHCHSGKDVTPGGEECPRHLLGRFDWYLMGEELDVVLLFLRMALSCIMRSKLFAAASLSFCFCCRNRSPADGQNASKRYGRLPVLTLTTFGNPVLNLSALNRVTNLSPVAVIRHRWRPKAGS